LLEIESGKYKVLWQDHQKLVSEFDERKKVSLDQENQISSLSSYIVELEGINRTSSQEHQKLVLLIQEHLEIQKNLNRHVDELKEENLRYSAIQKNDQMEHQKLVEYIKILEDDSILIKEDRDQNQSEKEQLSLELEQIKSQLGYRIWRKLKSLVSKK
ncbi:hypothetical protein MJH12_17945, partial [bacterium]|nr:hypothetical protein [bacterium]